MVWSEDGIGSSLRESFDRAAAELPERVRQMDEFQHEDEHCLLRLWSASHARPEHVQRLDRPSAMLAFVGNPTLVGESAASWPALLKDSLIRGAPALDAVWPPFCAFLRDLAADTLTIVADRSALQHLYIREDPGGTVWASTSAFCVGVIRSRTRSRGGDGVGNSRTLHHRPDVLSRSSRACLRRGRSPPDGRRDDTDDLGPDPSRRDDCNRVSRENRGGRRGLLAARGRSLLRVDRRH